MGAISLSLKSKYPCGYLPGFPVLRASKGELNVEPYLSRKFSYIPPSQCRYQVGMNVKTMTDNLLKSVRESLPDMTEELRAQAIKAGWDEEVANSLRVDLTKQQATVKVVPVKNYDAAWDFEHGTQKKGPTAAARKYPEKSPKGAAALRQNLSKNFEGVL